HFGDLTHSSQRLLRKKCFITTQNTKLLTHITILSALTYTGGPLATPRAVDLTGVKEFSACCPVTLRTPVGGGGVH
ncbi:MAG: hypothetical protein M3H12_21065, partial [Chromatiales bacterium]